MNFIRAALACMCACVLGTAAAATDVHQAEMFLRDMDGLVSQAQIQIDTMPKRRQHQAKYEELQKRAKRLFGDSPSSPFAPCVEAAGYLADAWTAQMVLVAATVTPHNVGGVAWTSFMAGDRRQQCRQAIEQLDADKHDTQRR